MSTKQRNQIPMILTMLTGAFAIFFTGFTHIWSIYQPYVITQTGWTVSQASMGFYISNCVFVVGNILGGKLQDRFGVKMVVAIGGGIFTAGIILSSYLLISSPVPMCLAYGVMQGMGQGIIYAVILATAQKWFPGRTGFASGVIVTSNGLCGFLLSPFSRILLEQYGPSWALRCVGILIAISTLLVSIFITVPPREWQNNETTKATASSTQSRQYTSSEMLHTKKYYYLLGTMLFGLIPYYLLSPISQSLQTDLGIPATVAVAAVMAGSLLNAATRLLLPTLADRIGRISCIRVVQILSIIAMLILAFLSSYAVTFAVVMMYICYGGIMGSFPSLTSSIFGMEHAAENYGYIMIGMIAASLGAPVISSTITAVGLSVRFTFGIGAILSCLSFLFLSLLKKELDTTTLI